MPAFREMKIQDLSPNHLSRDLRILWVIFFWVKLEFRFWVDESSSLFFLHKSFLLGFENPGSLFSW